MKLKTWLLLFLTLCILGIAVCLPIVLFDRQEVRLFDTVHTEKLAEPSSVQLPVTSTEEKLALIAAPNLADSSAITIKTSRPAEHSSLKQTMELVQKSLSELSQKEMIPEIDLSDFSINEIVHTVYSKAASQSSVSCYSFWANSEAYDLYIMMDADSGKLYSFTFISLPPGSDSSRFGITDRTPQIWAEHLGISLTPSDSLHLYGNPLYQVGDTNLFYLFSQSENALEINFQMAKTQTVDVDVANDSNMMGNRR